MTTKNLIVLLLILQSIFTFAQRTNQKWKEIPNKTHILFIQNGLPADENFTRAVNTLLDNNFEIERHDRSLGTITTAWHPLPRTGSYKLNIRCTEGRIQLSGQLLSGISTEMYGVRSDDSPETIQKVRAKKSLYGIAFTQMYTFAEKLGPVTW